METDVRDQLERWRAEMADKPLQSAQQVQDRLLDLYPVLRAFPVKHEVEKWLSLTRERSLFEGREINELLDGIAIELQIESLESDLKDNLAST